MYKKIYLLIPLCSEEKSDPKVKVTERSLPYSDLRWDGRKGVEGMKGDF